MAPLKNTSEFIQAASGRASSGLTAAPFRLSSPASVNKSGSTAEP